MLNANDTDTVPTGDDISMTPAQRHAAQTDRVNGRFAGHPESRRRELLAKVDERRQQGKTLWRIARELGVARTTLERWLADRAANRAARTPQIGRSRPLTTGPLHSRA